jgi:ABC-type Na+ efflux pump permease subunit
MPVMISLARVTLLEAFRNRLLWLIAAVIVVTFGIAQFLDQVAITETREIQAALLAALLRIAAVFIVVTFVITSTVREFNDKVTELLLSLPVRRASYLLGKFTGYALVGAVLALLCALPLTFFAHSGGLVAWTISLICELLIMAAVSLFCALSLTQVVPAFAAVAGFYLLSRSMAAMQLIADAALQDPTAADRGVSAVVNMIALVLPALDRMTQTAWLLDSSAPNPAVLGAVLGQTAIYAALIGAASLFDLYRKNF